MKRLFIILTVMAVVFGCTEQQHPLLRQVWGLIEVNPESAKVVLAKVHTNSLTERDKAEYGLLKTILISKTHGIYMVYGMIDNDSLISASIAYYNQHGDEWHRGHAYYYRGAIRMSKLGNMPGAVKDFKVAEMISEDADDEELKNLVYNSLHYVNIIIDNQSQTLKYAHKWLDSSIELKDSMKILRGLFNCATAYADMDQKDSAYTYMSKCLQLKKYASQDLLANIYSIMALIYEEKGETAKAEEYIKKWEGNGSYVNIGFPTRDGVWMETHSNLGNLTLARIRKTQGQYEKAIRLAELEVGMAGNDQKTRMKGLELLSELYELTGRQEQALEAGRKVKAYNDSMRYVNQTMQMADWQQKFDEVQQTKDFYRRTSWMQGLIIALIAMVALGIVIGMWWHRRKVRRLSFRLDEDAKRISELRTKIELQEKSGQENGQEMARLKEELENRMERISGTLLIGTQMFSQLQQHQCIAEATAKEQQCLVDYFAQLRPKRWQEWERKYSALSTAQYVFLIMQDDLRYDDEAIAAALNVKRVSVRSMRARIKKSER